MFSDRRKRNRNFTRSCFVPIIAVALGAKRAASNSRERFTSVTLDIESRGPSANLEDKSASVGANVVIIGGGNLSTRRRKGGGGGGREARGRGTFLLKETRACRALLFPTLSLLLLTGCQVHATEKDQVHTRQKCILGS